MSPYLSVFLLNNCNSGLEGVQFVCQPSKLIPLVRVFLGYRYDKLTIDWIVLWVCYSFGILFLVIWLDFWVIQCFLPTDWLIPSIALSRFDCLLCYSFSSLC